jgi:hypothetical protein
MIEAVVWIVVKYIDYFQTYSFVQKRGWEAEGNPLFIENINRIGWTGTIIGTLLVGYIIWLILHLSKLIGGEIQRFIYVFVWLFLLVNFLNIFRNFLIDINIYPTVLP